MSAEILFLTVISLGLVIGARLGWITFFRTGKLRKQLTRLQQDLDRLQKRPGQAVPRRTTAEKPPHYILYTDSPTLDSILSTQAARIATI
jgi:hypothetical protein